MVNKATKLKKIQTKSHMAIKIEKSLVLPFTFFALIPVYAASAFNDSLNKSWG